MEVMEAVLDDSHFSLLSYDRPNYSGGMKSSVYAAVLCSRLVANSLCKRFVVLHCQRGFLEVSDSH